MRKREFKSHCQCVVRVQVRGPRQTWNSSAKPAKPARPLATSATGRDCLPVAVSVRRVGQGLYVEVPDEEPGRQEALRIQALRQRGVICLGPQQSVVVADRVLQVNRIGIEMSCADTTGSARHSASATTPSPSQNTRTSWAWAP